MTGDKTIIRKPNSAGVDPQEFKTGQLLAQPEPVKNAPKEDCENPSLRRWRVMEVVSQSGTRSRHVYGHDVTNNTGRASSAIKKFDDKNMTVTTRSGSNYTLIGAPGNARIGEYAWKNRCRINEVTSEVDVTSQYFSADTLFP